MRRRLVLLASIFSLAAGLLFMRPEPRYAALSTLFIIALALPSLFALLRWLGPARGAAAAVVLGALSLAVEALAVLTGIPYGAFSYSPALGLSLFDLVPWTVAFAYLPILLGAVTLASRVGSFPARVAATGGLVVLADLAIDPGAVHAGFWAWSGGGPYYGVPPVNFAGWAITGMLYGAIFFLLVGGEKVPPGVASSLMLIIALWSGYNLGNGLLLPGAIGLLFLAGIVAADHGDGR
ncbi:MAG: carotenoid biosynthesis protein [Methanomicrobiaceae archaeon]|nr:carotenoid biosynthesis protein [Methanomicrobiaceae archaeon]